MSDELDDSRPIRARWFVWWLNVMILLAVVVWAACLPLGMLYTAMNDGVPLPQGHASFATFFICSLVGPVLVLNVFWLISAFRRWRSGSTLPEPESAQHGCSSGLLLLSLLTEGVLFCLIPSALWFPFGMFYAAMDYDDHYLLRDFHNHLSYLVWSVVGLLAVINLVWMLYALYFWRTRPLPPDPTRFPTIPEGVSDRFAPLRLPQIKADKGVQCNQ